MLKLGYRIALAVIAGLANFLSESFGFFGSLGHRLPRSENVHFVSSDASAGAFLPMAAEIPARHILMVSGIDGLAAFTFVPMPVCVAVRVGIIVSMIRQAEFSGFN